MFDLTIKQCNAGPAGARYRFSTPQGTVYVRVLSSTNAAASNSPQSILIRYRNTIKNFDQSWLYEFRSNQVPGEEPKFLLTENGDLSIQGAGILMPLDSGGLRLTVAGGGPAPARNGGVRAIAPGRPDGGAAGQARQDGGAGQPHQDDGAEAHQDDGAEEAHQDGGEAPEEE